MDSPLRAGQDEVPEPRSRVPSDAMELDESPSRVRFDRRATASRRMSDPMRWGATIMSLDHP